MHADLRWVCLAAFGAVAAADKFQHTWARPEEPLNALYDMAFKDYASTPCTGKNGRKGPLQCYQTQDDFYKLASVASEQEFQAFLDGAAGDEDGRAVLLPFPASSNQAHGAAVKAVLGSLKEEGARESVDAVLMGVLNQDAFENGFSPHWRYPTNGTDLYKDDPNRPQWNPTGMELFDTPLPFLGFTATGVTAGLKGTVDEGRAEVQLNYAMQSAGMTSVECLNAAKCDVMGSYSVLASPIDMSTDAAVAGKKFVALTMPLDGTSLLSTSYCPADGAVLGTITAALAVIDAISQRAESFSAFAPLFVFLENEAHGAAGSWRFFHDLKYPEEQEASYHNSSKAWTRVSRDAIGHLIALDQLGVVEINTTHDPTNAKLFSYYDDAQKNASPKTDELLAAFGNNGGRSAGDKKAFLPPSAAHAFLHDSEMRERSDLGVMAVTGYDGAFENKYYGSIYDTANVGLKAEEGEDQPPPPRLSKDLLKQSSDALLGTLWQINGNAAPAPTVDEALVEDVLVCLTKNFSCSLVQSYLSTCRAEAFSQAFSPRPSLYTSIVNGQAGPVATFVSLFAAAKFARNGTGAECSLDAECSDDNGLPRCMEAGEVCVPLLDGTKYGVCKRTTAEFHHSHSPALKVATDADGKHVFSYDDERYPNLDVWTEATWYSTQGMRAYRSQHGTASVGPNLVLVYCLFVMSGGAGAGATWLAGETERMVARVLCGALLAWTLFFLIYGWATVGWEWQG